MESAQNTLRELFIKYDIPCSAGQRGSLEKYMELVLKKNKHVNLTSIDEPYEFLVKHFLDSAVLLKTAEYENAGKILDLGTGGGFPGVPLAILSPEKIFTLIDSLSKKVRAVEEMTSQVRLSNVEVMHGRAEELAANADFRDRYDMCVSRAVSNFATLVEYCLPFVKKGGFFVAYKSGNFEEELSDAGSATDALKGEFYSARTFDIEGNSRTLIFIRKTEATPDRFPRKAGKALKNPIKDGKREVK